MSEGVCHSKALCPCQSSPEQEPPVFLRIEFSNGKHHSSLHAVSLVPAHVTQFIIIVYLPGRVKLQHYCLCPLIWYQTLNECRRGGADAHDDGQVQEAGAPVAHGHVLLGGHAPSCWPGEEPGRATPHRTCWHRLPTALLSFDTANVQVLSMPECVHCECLVRQHLCFA